MTCIFLIIERNSRNKFQRNYLQNQNHFIKVLLDFWNLHIILRIFFKKDDLDNFNISGVIDSEKCGYLNAQKLLFQNTLWK